MLGVITEGRNIFSKSVWVSEGEKQWNRWKNLGEGKIVDNDGDMVDTVKMDRSGTVQGLVRTLPVHCGVYVMGALHDMLCRWR